MKPELSNMLPSNSSVQLSAQPTRAVRASSDMQSQQYVPEHLLFQGATGLHKGDRPYQQDQVALIPHHFVPGCLLGVVADGMGGKTGGRTASNQAIQTARQLFSTYSPFEDSADMLLRQIAIETHVIVGLTSITSEEEPHTTFAAFLINPDGRAHIAHCGDSRVYLFNQNTLVHCTKDHSYVQTLIDSGKLTPKEALSHPKSNLITSCLGIYLDQGPTITQFTSAPLTIGCSLLACSDGLWHGVSPEEMGWTVAKFPPKEACTKLVEHAYSHADGHSDNISVIIARVSGIADN